MRSRLLGLTCAVAMAMGGAAEAAVVVGTFSGTITSGAAWGNFGYGGPGFLETDLTGQAITGTFRYDTSKLTNCTDATSFFGCFRGGGVLITQTINGFTETITSSPAPEPDAETSGAGGLLLYSLTRDDANLHARSEAGMPNAVYTYRDVGLAFGLSRGAIADATNPVLTYDGPIGAGSGLTSQGQRFAYNQTYIYQLTDGDLTQRTEFQFSIARATFALEPAAAAVPEPAAWALMIGGFGMAGGVLRRRRLVAGV